MDNKDDLKQLTQSQIEEMTGEEIKTHQRELSDDKIKYQKERLQFSIVSLIFFLFLIVILLYYPIHNLSIIAPIIFSLIFIFKIGRAYEGLQIEVGVRNMMEYFYKESNL